MENKVIGVIGASSFVGSQLLQILEQSGWQVVAFSRQTHISLRPNIEWRCISNRSISVSRSVEKESIPIWICVAPNWVLPDYFNLLKAYGARHVVALSSTSRFTKRDSSDSYEQALVQRLINGEACLQSWAEDNGINWSIVRPTMIYGLGKDKNVAEIIRLIRRWGFFPILGEGGGLRQPVHVMDVVKVCLTLVTAEVKMNHAYNISGGETLSYKDMVTRIFSALDKKLRIVFLPRWSFRLVLVGLHFIPRFRNWSVAMVDRMDQDMVFDHKEATAELGFSPRSFFLEKRDLP